MDRPLHIANVVTAFGVLADIAFCSGISTGIGAALSGHALLEAECDSSTKVIAHSMAEGAETALDSFRLTGDRRKIVLQMLHLHRPSMDDILSSNMNPAAVAEVMRKRVHAEANDPAHTTPSALNSFENVLTATLSPALASADGLDAGLQGAAIVELLIRTDKLLQQTESTGHFQRLVDAGITESAVIQLARRIAEDIVDLRTAWLELQNAIDIAINIQEKGGLDSNENHFIVSVMSQVAELARQGEYEEANNAIKGALIKEENAFSELESEHRQNITRLLSRGAELAMLKGDIEGAAEYLIKKVDADNVGAAEFRKVQLLYLDQASKALKSGIMSDWKLALEISRELENRAKCRDEELAARNHYANTLSEIGERETSSKRLLEAVGCFRRLIENVSRVESPSIWASFQLNLGVTLKVLAERDGRTNRYRQAIYAFELALEETTQWINPETWANLQSNKGTAHQRIGEAKSSTFELNNAITAFREAILVFMVLNDTFKVAMVQCNLGTALREIGFLERDTARINEALYEYRLAAKYYKENGFSLEVAKTDLLSANALMFKYAVSGEIGLVEEASEILNEARPTIEKSEMPFYIEKLNKSLASIDEVLKQV